MNKLINQSTTRTGFKPLIRSIIFLLFVLQLPACEKENDRTTGAFGTVTYPDGKPAEGVKVTVFASKGSGTSAVLVEKDTDKDGKYEITFDAPTNFDSFNVKVLLSATDNPELFKTFKGTKVMKNEVGTDQCCYTNPGDRTRYDFELIPK